MEASIISKQGSKSAQEVYYKYYPSFSIKKPPEFISNKLLVELKDRNCPEHIKLNDNLCDLKLLPRICRHRTYFTSEILANRQQTPKICKFQERSYTSYQGPKFTVWCNKEKNPFISSF